MLLSLFLPVITSATAVTNLQKTSTGITFQVAGVTKRLSFYAPNSVRVNANLGASYENNPSFSISAKPAHVSFSVTQSAEGLVLQTKALKILVDPKTGSLTFAKPNGDVITSESTTKPASVAPKTISGAPTYEVSQTFKLSDGESLYGLGQYNSPYMDYRNQDVLLVQTNIGIVVPFLVSTKRYGIVWDVASKGTFKDSPDGATFWGESSPAGIDYYFIAGEDMDGVIRGYRHLTGDAPMYPKAAFGLFMSKERYQTQQELVTVVENFRKAKFPLDYIVQDWQYWGGSDGTWSGMTWDRTRYPDPVGLTKQLHNELHVKLMNSIWPSVGDDTALAKELDAKGLRFKPLHWISRKARIYDAYSPEGRAIYFNHIKKGLLDVGVDALWMDGTEVEVGGACHDAGEVERDIKGLGNNAAGDFTRNLNNYTLLTTKGTYEGQRATSNKRALTLTRSAWLGQQRYAAMPWSGDTGASWESLHAQISGGINVCMAGLPYWTQDTGGFFVNYPGGEGNPEYRELFNRWHQFGVFNPVYRIHGTNIQREPYRFVKSDPEFYQALLDAATLRYRMMPYLYSLGWMSTSQGYTMMRGLPMDFPDDPAVRKIDDAYMFGPAFLVHPVTKVMYNAPAPPAPTVPTSALQTPDGQPGLALEYFEGVNFDRSVSKTIDRVIDHNWPEPPLADIPAGLTSLNNFSARWTGKLTAPEEGEYELGLEGDDGFRLWIDGKLIAEDWNAAAKRYRGGKVHLAKGQVVSVRIDFYQGYRERVLRFSWRTPSDLKAMASTQSKLDNTLDTYLPEGEWFDFWTNERLTGGKKVNTVCPMNRFPLFVRAGSILPLGPFVQYANEMPDAPYEIRVYPGRNASFDVYEDDNETYAYEKGERATIPLRWDDAKGVLTIGARKGRFPGMVELRKFRVTLMKPQRGAGIEAIASPDAEVSYSGKAIQVRLSQ